MNDSLRQGTPGRTKTRTRVASTVPATLLLCGIAVAWSGCGGRLKPLPGSESDQSTPDGGFDFDAGEDAAAEADADAAPPNPCGSAAPPPGCVLTSTCDWTFFPTWTVTFYGGWVGFYPYETISTQCKSPPSTVEQWIDGAWVPLEMWVGNAGELGTIGRPITIFDLDSTSGTLATPTAGAPTGSVQQVRACRETTIATSGACSDPMSVSVVKECDPPTAVTIVACTSCAPVICAAGYETINGCTCIVTPPVVHPTGG